MLGFLDYLCKRLYLTTRKLPPLAPSILSMSGTLRLLQLEIQDILRLLYGQVWRASMC
jgi:hypothetical protein